MTDAGWPWQGTQLGWVLYYFFDMLLYMRTTKLSYGLLAIFSYQFCGLALDSNTIPYNLGRYLLTIFKEMQGISRYLKIAMKEFAGFSFSCFSTAYHVGTPKDGSHMGSTNFVDQQNSIITCKYLWIGKWKETNFIRGLNGHFRNRKKWRYLPYRRPIFRPM